MTNRFDRTVLSDANIEEVIMNVAKISAPRESANRVAQQALERTNGGPASSPPSSGRSKHIFVGVTTSALVLVAIVLLSTDFFAGKVAFAQVQQNLESTQSLQYVEYLTEVGAQRELEEAEKQLEMFQHHVKAMAKHSKEVDSELIEKETTRIRDYVRKLKAKIESGESIEQRRVWIQGRYLHRAEQSGMGSTAILITNARTGESVSLDPDRKSCTLMKTQTVLNIKSGEKTVTPIGPNPASNFYTAMTQIPPGTVMEVGEKQLDGKEATGFRQTEDLGDSVVTRTYWIDKTTKLPIRLEAIVRKDGVAIGGTTICDMLFNQKVDQQMFSTNPPEGYSVREGGFMGLELGTSAD